MFKPFLISLALALSSLGSVVHAELANQVVIDQTFFNVGGPNKALNTAAPAVGTSSTTKEPDPMPDPALFTSVNNLNEQTQDNAVDIFGLKRQKTAAAQVPASADPANPQATVASTTPATNEPGMPDPSLFTNTGTPKEQVREHPFKLF